MFELLFHLLVIGLEMLLHINNSPRGSSIWVSWICRALFMQLTGFLWPSLVNPRLLLCLFERHIFVWLADGVIESPTQSHRWLVCKAIFCSMVCSNMWVSWLHRRLLPIVSIYCAQILSKMPEVSRIWRYFQPLSWHIWSTLGRFS